MSKNPQGEATLSAREQVGTLADSGNSAYRETAHDFLSSHHLVGLAHERGGSLRLT